MKIILFLTNRYFPSNVIPNYGNNDVGRGKGDVVIECIVICAHVCYLNYYLYTSFSLLSHYGLEEDKKILDNKKLAKNNDTLLEDCQTVLLCYIKR